MSVRENASAGSVRSPGPLTAASAEVTCARPVEQDGRAENRSLHHLLVVRAHLEGCLLYTSDAADE